MTLDNNWYSEIHAGQGTAFSMQIKKRLHEEQSQFQHIEIYETETFGNLMIIDDCVMLTHRDNFIYHEMMSHPVLFQHPNPQNVLIIGGGDCGTLKEVLKHKTVKKVQQIDIDERVTRLSEIYFPELCESNNDPRAELMFIDGIKWVKERAPASYDIIIVDSTDPIGPGEGLFTKAFYADCFNALSDNGILIQQSESPLLHIKLIRDIRQAMLSAGYEACSTLFFPQCVYPSGWWSATMAFKNAAACKVREQDIVNKSFPTEYFNLDVQKAAFAAPEFVRKALGE